MSDRYELFYRETYEQREPTKRTFADRQKLDEFVDKHRQVAHAVRSRRARKGRLKLKRKGAWVWYQIRIALDQNP